MARDVLVQHPCEARRRRASPAMRRAAAPQDRPVLPFFAVAFVWSWALWWTAAATGRSFTEPVGFMLYMTGGLGPLLGAVWVVHRGGPAYRRAFLRRVWDPRGIRARWWLALVAVTTLPAALGAALAGVVGVAATVPDYSFGLALGAGMLALAAGLVEEPGWRGVAADAWQERTQPVWAALGIGALWSLWHLPLSAVEGSYLHGLGFGTVRFWLTHLMLVQLGVLYVWLTNGSGGSVLMAILAHAGFNMAVGLRPHSTTGDAITFLVLAAATVAVVVATKGRLCFAAATPEPETTVGGDPHGSPGAARLVLT
jgi:uncharacterized protein